MNTSNYEHSGNATNDCKETTAKPNGAQQKSGSETQGAATESRIIPTQVVVNSAVAQLLPLVKEEVKRISRLLLAEATFALLAGNQRKSAYSVLEMQKALVSALQKLFGMESGSCQ